MSITKAFLYTFFVFLLWVAIQLSIHIPVRYLIGKPDDLTHILWLSKIVSYLGVFLLIYLFFWRPKVDIPQNLDIKNYDAKICLFLFLLGIGLYLAHRPLWDFSKILTDIKDPTSPKTITIIGNRTELIYSFIYIIIIAPVIEELFFRGFLFRKLIERNSIKVSMLISSICFSAIHLETPNNILPALISGILLAFVYLKTTKIGYSIILHIIINAIIWTTNNFPIFLNSRYFNYTFDLIYWLLSGVGVFLIIIGIYNVNKMKTSA